MFRVTSLAVALVLAAAGLAGDVEKLNERLSNAATVLEEILTAEDNIPKDLLDRAECVVVVPSTKEVAFGFGGTYGRGVMVCRTGQNFTGPWGAPAMYALEGGSFGLQIGGKATDFVFLVMNQRGAQSLWQSNVKLGADAAVAAGPKGREAAAATDAYMRAEILSYSRSGGVFAGIALEGSTLRPDNDANKELYGRELPVQEILTGSAVQVPPAGQRLVSMLRRVSPRNLSK